MEELQSSQYDVIALRIENCENRCDDLELRMGRLEIQVTSSNTGQAVMENELKNIDNSLKRIEESIKDYFERAQKSIVALEVRVKDLEDKPSNFWNSVGIGIIIAVVSSIITYIITRGKA